MLDPKLSCTFEKYDSVSPEMFDVWHPLNLKNLNFFGQMPSKLLSNVSQNKIQRGNVSISHFVKRIFQDKSKIFCLILSAPPIVTNIQCPSYARELVGTSQKYCCCISIVMHDYKILCFEGLQHSSRVVSAFYVTHFE